MPPKKRKKRKTTSSKDGTKEGDENIVSTDKSIMKKGGFPIKIQTEIRYLMICCFMSLFTFPIRFSGHSEAGQQ